MELMTASSECESAKPTFDVGLSLKSQANLYRGFDSEVPLGVFVPTWSAHAVGTRVSVTIDLPNAPRVAADAVVHWVRETSRESMWPGLGLAFVDLTDEQRLALLDFCEQRSPMFYDF